MKEDRLRTLVRESDQKPVRIFMDDGRSYTISHPDFGMVASGASSLAVVPDRIWMVLVL
jgi:hypothetical protein